MAQPSSVPKNHSDNSRRYQHADEQCHGDVSQADDHRLAQKRHAGFAHNAQIDGVKPQLCEYSRKNGRDAQTRVQKAGYKSCKHAGKYRENQRKQRVHSHQNQHGACRAAGAKAAVHRQICDVQQLIGHIHAQSHDAPDEPLRRRAGNCRNDAAHNDIRPLLLSVTPKCVQIK